MLSWKQIGSLLFISSTELRHMWKKMKICSKLKNGYNNETWNSQKSINLSIDANYIAYNFKS